MSLDWTLERRGRLTEREMTQFHELLAACNAAEQIHLPFFYPEVPGEPSVDEHVLVRSGDRLVGFGRLPSGDEPEGCLMVHPDHRRQGIGTVLLDALSEMLRERGLDQSLLVADQASPSGKAFLAARAIPHESSEFRLEWSSSQPCASIAEVPGLTMRPAGGSDSETLVDVMGRSFDRDLDDVRDRVAEGLRETKRRFYLASVNGTPVGILRAGEVDGAGDITAFGVLPEFRGRGIGRWMLTNAVQRLADQGFKRVLIEVATGNANALGLYESCGFRIVSEYGFYTLSASTSARAYD